MAKRGGNHPIPGHFKVQGGAVEDRDLASMNKQALVREAARLERRAPKKKTAPKQKRAPIAKPVDVEVPASFARAHDREFAAMNERKPAKRVKRGNGDDVHQPRYLAETARGVLQRMARVALAPLALARAVVDRFRDHD